jgi:hypothetical protein
VASCENAFKDFDYDLAFNSTQLNRRSDEHPPGPALFLHLVRHKRLLGDSRLQQGPLFSIGPIRHIFRPICLWCLPVGKEESGRMTIQEKKQKIEDFLRRLGIYPSTPGSITFHINAENKVAKIEIKTVE